MATPRGWRTASNLPHKPTQKDSTINTKSITLLAGTCLSALALTACSGSNADTVSDNISKEAEQFKVQRKIIGINGITDKILFEVEGKCSIEPSERLLVAICKHNDNDYRKHYIGLSDNVTFVNVQSEGIKVSEYRTKIIIRPQSLVPDLDLVTGSRDPGGVTKDATTPTTQP